MVRQYERNRYAFSEFLCLAEQSDLRAELRDFPGVPFEFFGGVEDAERVVLRLGDSAALGYDEPWPISLVEIKPKNEKFADALTHRDFLGAVLNLGLTRERIGDIYIADHTGYVFCLDTNASFIVDQLERVKHTSVTCRLAGELPPIPTREPDVLEVQCASLRLDLILSKVYQLSRSEAEQLFAADRVFVDGRVCRQGSRELTPGALVSVRGYGRLRLLADAGFTRKGNHKLQVAITK